MADHDPHEQVPVPCSIVRGGTSKGVYFHEADIPAPGARRDKFLQAVMGSPDILQIDGLGGSRLITSKVGIVRRSAREDADVDYTYAQVVPDRDIVSYAGNCGNISSGVGPYAIDAGLVAPVEPVTAVRIFNTNTGKILVAHVPVRRGRAQVRGDVSIPGVPGTGAGVFMDYRHTVGAKTGKLLPTGNVVDTLELSGGARLEITLGDVANPCVFVRAADMGLTGSELPPQIDEDAVLIRRLREIRGRAAVLAGFCGHWEEAETRSPSLPLVVIVAPPADYADMNGAAVAMADMDFRARLVFYNKCHESMAGTGSMCTAAISRVRGSIAHQAVGSAAAARPALRIGHPLGVMHVEVAVSGDESPATIRYRRLGFERTARKILDGQVYVPAALLGKQDGQEQGDVQ